MGCYVGISFRYAYSVSYVADNAPLLQEDGHIRIPDNEDYQASLFTMKTNYLTTQIMSLLEVALSSLFSLFNNLI